MQLLPFLRIYPGTVAWVSPIMQQSTNYFRVNPETGSVLIQTVTCEVTGKHIVRWFFLSKHVHTTVTDRPRGDRTPLHLHTSEKALVLQATSAEVRRSLCIVSAVS